MSIYMQTAKNVVLSKIYGKGRGWAFSAVDFMADLSRWKVDRSLSDLAREGKIRRLIQGLYDYPLYSEILKRDVAPDIQKAAEAIARKYSWRIYPDGDTALNYLGLSSQVVSRVIYLSDGPSKQYQIGKRILIFKHTATKESAVKSQNTAMVIQAIKVVGEKQITDEFLQKLSNKFSLPDWQKIKSDATKTTGWIYKTIVHIIGNIEEKNSG